MVNGNSPKRTQRRPARRGSSGPTVSDVAAVAGVSLMTVSRVVNGEPGVTAPTRAKVDAAIAELGYVPNLAARSLAGQGPCRLALLYHNPSAAFMSELLMGSLEGARLAEAELQVEPYDPAEEPEPLCQRLRRHRIDGVLLPAPMCDDLAAVEGIHAHGFAIARMASTITAPFGHAVFIDDEAAAHVIVAHLIGLGHSRLGFIRGPVNHPVSALRAAGYARALCEAGIYPDPDLTAQGDFTYRSGLDAAEALLALAVPPTAIFACNDDMAAATVSVAHRRGLAVPGDLSVCGFDDTAMARTIWPELTTIRQPVAAMASHGARLLADHIRACRRGETPPWIGRRLDFELVRRASDGPPA
jgi:LacI family transcriptional regulator